MRRFGMLLSLIASAAGVSGVACAQSQPVTFTCIVGNHASPPVCPDHSTPLSDYSSATPPTDVSAAGFYSPGDGGAGEFYRLGSTTAATPVCATTTQTTAPANGTVGRSTINDLTSQTLSGLVVGELVSGSGSDPSGSIQTQPGAEIASISKSQVTLTQPLTGTATDSSTPFTSVTFTGNNGGTLIVDVGGDCYQKTNYRGDPHEWGAVGDGSTDDTGALQDWLGGPGPWDATIAANYLTNAPLSCGPDVHLQATANDSLGGNATAPIVQITIGAGFPSTGSASAHNAVVTAWTLCRISGLAINAQFPGAPANNNYIDAVMVGPGASTVGLGPNQVANADEVVIDGHTLLLHGYYNLGCIGPNIGPGNHGGVGLQLKDSQFTDSWSDNVHVMCANVRENGDIFTGAGLDVPAGFIPPATQAGVYFGSDDLTLMGGAVQTAQGPGVMLDAATNVSITGMYLDTNGQYLGAPGLDWPGVLVTTRDGTSHTISICGNHFHENDNGNANQGLSNSTAHIRFDGSGSTGGADDITLCGNVYLEWNKGQGITPYPAYVYDVTGAAPTHVNIYENPVPQFTGVYSPAALAVLLPQRQANPGTANNYITGFTLANNANTPKLKIDILPGQAVDSTDEFIITRASPCTEDLDLGQPGPGGIDVASSASPNTTYFFFVIGGPNVSANCIASASALPDLTNAQGYTIFRMVGVLYTDANSYAVQFVQSDDRITLDTSVAFNASVGSTSTPVAVSSVPGQIPVEAFGRCAASGPVMLSAGGVTAQRAGSPFSSPPGYMVNSSAPNTPFPYALRTLGLTSPPVGGTINGAASGPAVTLTCYNDGWIWHRGR